jgi:hypothetical protein
MYSSKILCFNFDSFIQNWCCDFSHLTLTPHSLGMFLCRVFGRGFSISSINLGPPYFRVSSLILPKLTVVFFNFAICLWISHWFALKFSYLLCLYVELHFCLRNTELKNTFAILIVIFWLHWYIHFLGITHFCVPWKSYFN